MKAVEFIIETIAGTTTMTVFSYVVSASFRKLFAEPVLLNYVIRLSRIEIKPKFNSAFGWFLHYCVGLVFILIYHWLWDENLMDESWLSGIILGSVSGITGILGWMLIFRLPSREPHVAFKEYYLQLFFAHLFFALPVLMVHKGFNG